MKRIGVLLVSVLLLLSLTSCNEGDNSVGRDEIIGEIIGGIVTKIGHIVGYKYDHEIMDDSCNRLIDAICNRDSSALKALFSKKALMEADDFDETVSELFDLFQGEVVSYWRDGPSTFGEYEDGKGKKELQSDFKIETTEAKYHIAINQIRRNDWNPDEIGIYTIWVVKTPEFREYASEWALEDGVWLPGIEIGELDETGELHKLS